MSVNSDHTKHPGVEHTLGTDGHLCNALTIAQCIYSHEYRLVTNVIFDCLSPFTACKDCEQGHKGEQQALLALLWN